MLRHRITRIAIAATTAFALTVGSAAAQSGGPNPHTQLALPDTPRDCEAAGGKWMRETRWFGPYRYCQMPSTNDHTRFNQFLFATIVAILIASAIDSAQPERAATN